MDEIIEFYKKKVDRAAIRENLKKTPEERLRDLQEEVRRREAHAEDAMSEDLGRS